MLITTYSFIILWFVIVLSFGVHRANSEVKAKEHLRKAEVLHESAKNLEAIGNNLNKLAKIANNLAGILDNLEKVKEAQQNLEKLKKNITLN